MYARLETKGMLRAAEEKIGPGRPMRLANLVNIMALVIGTAWTILALILGLSVGIAAVAQGTPVDRILAALMTLALLAAIVSLWIQGFVAYRALQANQLSFLYQLFPSTRGRVLGVDLRFARLFLYCALCAGLLLAAIAVKGILMSS
jgi:hypothetical protein